MELQRLGKQSVQTMKLVKMGNKVSLTVFSTHKSITIVTVRREPILNHYSTTMLSTTAFIAAVQRSAAKNNTGGGYPRIPFEQLVLPTKVEGDVGLSDEELVLKSLLIANVRYVVLVLRMESVNCTQFLSKKFR